MAQQTMNGGMYFPDPGWSDIQNQNTNMTATSIATANAGVALIFEAPLTGTIDRIAFRVVGHTSAATLDIRLETVDLATGLPSGSLVGSASGTQLTSAGNTSYVVTLGSGGSVTRGTFYAMVVKQPSSSAGSCTIAVVDSSGSNAINFGRNRLCYTGTHNGTSWSKDNGRYVAAFACRYSDTNYYWTPGALPLSDIVETSFNSGSNPSQRGTKITLPFPATVTGFFFVGACSGQDYTVKLYTSDQTERASFSGDKDVFGGYIGTSYGGLYVGYFDAPYAVAASTALYLMLTPSSTTNVMLRETSLVDTATTAIMGMMNGGTNVISATRNGGAFTDVSTGRPLCMGLIINGADDGAGGGGGGGLIYNAGMTGGIVG